MILNGCTIGTSYGVKPVVDIFMIIMKTGATDTSYWFFFLFIYCSLILSAFFSDRFVWRRCSDPTCARFEEGKEKIELAAYSYDNGEAYNSYHRISSTILIYSSAYVMK